MGYLDKQRKKIEAEKKLKEIMNTQAYREMQKKLQDEAIKQAEANFCIVTGEFLGLKHRYKSRGFINYLLFASDRFKYSIDENQQYLSEMNDRWIEEHGFDALEYIDLAMKNDDKKRTCKCGKVIHVESYNFCPYCGEELKGVETDGQLENNN